MWRLFYSVAMCAAVTTATAQLLPDTVRNPWLPTGIRVGTDLIALGKTLAQQPLTGWEINADVDFKTRYYLVLDYGQWGREEILTNGQYEGSGRYWRAGIDVNFLLKDPDRNMFFIGFRVGRAGFDETLTTLFDYEGFGPIMATQANSGLRAAWGELTTGLRIKVVGGFWMGYTARFKFAPGVRGNEVFDAYDIPGYGRADRSTYWGFNYQVFWRVPFSRQ